MGKANCCTKSNVLWCILLIPEGNLFSSTGRSDCSSGGRGTRSFVGPSLCPATSPLCSLKHQSRPRQSSISAPNYIFALWRLILLALLTRVIWYTHVFLSHQSVLLSLSLCFLAVERLQVSCASRAQTLCQPPVLLGRSGIVLCGLLCVTQVQGETAGGSSSTSLLGTETGLKLLRPYSHFDTNHAGQLWTSIYSWSAFSALSDLQSDFTLCRTGELVFKTGGFFVQDVFNFKG